MVSINECPNCGAGINATDKKCPFCRGPILVSSINESSSLTFVQLQKYQSRYKQLLADASDDVDLNISLGMIYMKLKLYDNAESCFSKAIDKCFDNPDLFFAAAICQLRGKKAFLTPRANIDNALNYIHIAQDIESKSIYYLFEAYIANDYFERKCFSYKQTSRQIFETAIQHGLGNGDITTLFDLLGVTNPF